jgi:maltose alpha-D-glucosyltransferase/alpha-amylase
LIRNITSSCETSKSSTRRILDLRKQFPAFGNGSFEALPSSNAKIFAFIRETEKETLLVVANLSRLSQYVELDLSRYQGRQPMELFGRTEFPTIGEDPYLLSLGPHGFFWFCISCRDSEDYDDRARELPTVRTRNDIHELFKGRGRKALGEALMPYLKHQRWFAGKARTLQLVDIPDYFQVEGPAESSPRFLLVATANYADGEPDAYTIPVTLLDEGAAAQLMATHPRAGIIKVETSGSQAPMTLCEATWEPDFWTQLLSAISTRAILHGSQGTITGSQTAAYARLAEKIDGELVPTIHGGEQSNTSALFDEAFILKLFRRVSPGINPDLEIGRQLTENAELSILPQVAGALEYRSDSGRLVTLAVLHQFVPNVGDAWTHALDELDRYFERVQTADAQTLELPGLPPQLALQQVAVDTKRPLLELSVGEPPLLAQHMIGGFLSWAELLGRRVGELHVALANAGGGSAFAPEPFTRLYQRSLYQSMRGQARATIDLLRANQHRLSEEVRAQVEQMLECERPLYSKFGELTHELISAKRIRCHGDLHLGQVLYTGTDFVIIDFEGEPERAVSERRIKASPLRDVAGMIRSFHYAAHAARRVQSPALIMQHASVSIEEWAGYWSAWVSAEFMRGYLAAAQPGGFLPKDPGQLNTLLRSYLLEKAFYEVRYEMNNRPDWIGIPLEAIRQYCGNNQEGASV